MPTPHTTSQAYPSSMTWLHTPRWLEVSITSTKAALRFFYDRVLRHQKMTMDKSNTRWDINLNVPARSMKSILMLFENVAAQQSFASNTDIFYNPKITKVEVTIEGSQPALQSKDARLSDVGRGKEVLCSIARL